MWTGADKNSSNVEFTTVALYRSVMDHVLQLDEIDSSMIDAVGGKALNLGVMTAAGLPVPGGFCVGTGAYGQVVGGRLDDLISDLASTTQPSELAGLATQARDRILATAVPDQLGAVITAHYRELGDDVPVAVRSSATAEDLAYASFAGQQDTYLNVVGADALIDAIRRCWASLWTDRAVSYRTANGIDHRRVTLAVVVQRMIDAAVAGVMFTANPVTGTRHETVIDASPGLGEAVVSGAVNPDHFVVDTRSGAILQRRLGDKRIMIRSVAGGGTEEVTLDDRGDAACLTDDQLAALVGLGRKVQDHYGSPQDTEWAIDGAGNAWLTQARPITTLYPLPTSELPGTRIFMCLTLAQGLTRPITPMGLASFRLIGASVARAAGQPLSDPRSGPGPLRTVGQRLFLDITPMISNAFGRRLVITAFGVMEARASAVLRTLDDDRAVPDPLPVTAGGSRTDHQGGRAAGQGAAPVADGAGPAERGTQGHRPRRAPAARLDDPAGERDPGGTAGPGRESARHRGVPADAHGVRLSRRRTSPRHPGSQAARRPCPAG